MRNLRTLLLALALGALVFGAAPPIRDHAGTLEDPWPIYNTPTVAAKCDAYQDFEITMVLVEVSSTNTFAATDIVKRVQFVGSFAKGEDIKVPLRPHIDAIPNGVYHMRTQIADKNCNVSDWSDPIVVEKKWATIEKPSGCMITF